MRFDRYLPRRPRARGPGRIVLLAGLLALVLLGMWETHRRAGRFRTAREGKASAGATKPVPVEPIRQSEALERKGLLPPEQERALLARVQDQYDLAVLEQKEAYYYLIRKVRLLSLPQLLDHLDAEADFDDFAADPDLVRGAVVQVRGQLYRMEKEPMDLEASGVSHVYEGEVLGTDGNLYSFILVETPKPDVRPGRVTRRDRIPVRVTGVFLQNLIYTNRTGKPFAAPLIIAKEVARLPSETAPHALLPTWAAGALALVLLALGTWLLLRRPRAPAYRRVVGRGDGDATDLPSHPVPPSLDEDRTGEG